VLLLTHRRSKLTEALDAEVSLTVPGAERLEWGLWTLPASVFPEGVGEPPAAVRKLAAARAILHPLAAAPSLRELLPALRLSRGAWRSLATAGDPSSSADSAFPRCSAGGVDSGDGDGADYGSWTLRVERLSAPDDDAPPSAILCAVAQCIGGPPALEASAPGWGGEVEVRPASPHAQRSSALLSAACAQLVVLQGQQVGYVLARVAWVQPASLAADGAAALSWRQRPFKFQASTDYWLARILLSLCGATATAGGGSTTTTTTLATTTEADAAIVAPAAGSVAAAAGSVAVAAASVDGGSLDGRPPEDFCSQPAVAFSDEDTVLWHGGAQLLRRGEGPSAGDEAEAKPCSDKPRHADAHAPTAHSHAPTAHAQASTASAHASAAGASTPYAAARTPSAGACNQLPRGARYDVLDPCAGSGTILFAAATLGLSALGSDVNGRFVERAGANLRHALAQLEGHAHSNGGTAPADDVGTATAEDSASGTVDDGGAKSVAVTLVGPRDARHGHCSPLPFRPASVATNLPWGRGIHLSDGSLRSGSRGADSAASASSYALGRSDREAPTSTRLQSGDALAGAGTDEVQLTALLQGIGESGAPGARHALVSAEPIDAQLRALGFDVLVAVPVGARGPDGRTRTPVCYVTVALAGGRGGQDEEGRVPDQTEL
jgi:hypothetical protein